MREDAVDAEKHERQREADGGRARDEAAYDEVGQGGGDAAREHGVRDVMPIDAAEDSNDRGLDEERQRRVWKGKIAVGDVARGDACGVLEDVADVPEDGQARTLPKHDRGARQTEEAGNRAIVTVTSGFVRRCYDTPLQSDITKIRLCSRPSSPRLSPSAVKKSSTRRCRCRSPCTRSPSPAFSSARSGMSRFPTTRRTSSPRTL